MASDRRCWPGCDRESSEAGGAAHDVQAGQVLPFMREIQSRQGRVRNLGPVVTMSATPPHAEHPPVPFGTNLPEWLPR